MQNEVPPRINKQPGAIKIRSIYIALYSLVIFLMPLNGLPYLRSLFGELAYEGAFYPLLLLIAIFIIHGLSSFSNNRNSGFIGIPNQASCYILGIFCAWCVFSALANLESISLSAIKGRSGASKLTLQAFVLFLVIAATFIFYKVSRTIGSGLPLVQKAVLYTMPLVIAFSALEFFSALDFQIPRKILYTVTPYIKEVPAEAERLYPSGISKLRLSSISGEPSFLATYLSFSFPWIIALYFTARGRKRLFSSILLVLLVALVYFTVSRAGYIIITGQILAFWGLNGFLAGKKNAILKMVSVAAFIAIAAGSLVYFNERSAAVTTIASLSDMDNLSNIARYGSQLACFGIGLDHPIFGVGLGQYGFYARDYYPDWAFVSREIQNWASSEVDTSWPVALGLYARLFAEVGGVGLFIWLLFIGTAIFAVFSALRRESRITGQVNYLGLALLVSLFAGAIAGMNMESLRFFGIWICIAESWNYVTRSKSTFHTICNCYANP